MKPKITKDINRGWYYCTVPYSVKPPTQGATKEYWWKWAAFGMGRTPKEAYDAWLKDCEWEKGSE